MTHDIIINSTGIDDIRMSKDVEEAMHRLRRFMFQSVYQNPAAKGEEVKARELLKQLYGYYTEHLDRIPDTFLHMLDEGEEIGRVICDYISGMTDQYAVAKFSEYFMPQKWQVDGY